MYVYIYIYNIYIYIYIYITHTHRCRWLQGAACCGRATLSFQLIFPTDFTCQWYFPKDCHFPSDFFHWNCPIGFSGIFKCNFVVVISGV